MSTDQVAVSASIPPPLRFPPNVWALQAQTFLFKEVVFSLQIYILNPNQFMSTDQVAVSASIPPPPPFFLSNVWALWAQTY